VYLCCRRSCVVKVCLLLYIPFSFSAFSGVARSLGSSSNDGCLLFICAAAAAATAAGILCMQMQTQTPLRHLCSRISDRKLPAFHSGTRNANSDRNDVCVCVCLGGAYMAFTISSALIAFAVCECRLFAVLFASIAS
jgi:hypothetical protein